MRGKILLLGALACSTAFANWHEFSNSNGVALAYSDGKAAGDGKLAFSYRVVTGNTAAIYDVIGDCHDGTVATTAAKVIGEASTVNVNTIDRSPAVAAPGSVLYGVLQRLCG